MDIKTDICDVCEMCRPDVMEAITEVEKHTALDAFQDHLRVARAKRQQYNDRCQKSEQELKAKGFTIPAHPGTRRELKYQHYTDDFV